MRVSIKSRKRRYAIHNIGNISPDRAGRMEENTMFSLKKSFALLSTKVLAGSLALSPVNADACTRVVYLGPNADVITARSMDWNSDIGTNLWIFPKGMEPTGEPGRNPLTLPSNNTNAITSTFDSP